ncbi:hypothetical protein DET49_11421 [Salegentibacter sp. 24]|uniref:hypothetical protein n=1 Tax=Salegentibacter sp. 24 TaxID=2183986 RepID=UPI00105CDA9A|nr:hypothetical protein [Salegentibacter sp. 24]TDN87067.1 hypothetical protein DET49_11421 [Salegentibacter sp. 24]
MSKRNEILREILNDEEVIKKYNLSETEVKNLTTSGPYHNKIIEILATIINENDNNRSARQIYPIIKNIHKI